MDRPPPRWWAPLARVAVAGSSMEPTLSDGDWVLAVLRRHPARIPVGRIVVVERPDRPGLLLVKRAVRRTDRGWWVEGDNTHASDDSRTFGPVPDSSVVAMVVARYHPDRRLFWRA